MCARRVADPGKFKGSFDFSMMCAISVIFPGFILKHHHVLLFLGAMHSNNQRFSQLHSDLLASFRNFQLALLRNEMRHQKQNYSSTLKDVLSGKVFEFQQFLTNISFYSRVPSGFIQIRNQS